LPGFFLVNVENSNVDIRRPQRIRINERPTRFNLFTHQQKNKQKNKGAGLEYFFDDIRLKKYSSLTPYFVPYFRGKALEDDSRQEEIPVNVVRSSSEFIVGMQNIERDIISKARNKGMMLTANHFKWNRGSSLVPPPSEITLEIHLHGKTANAVLSRVQIEESHERVDRADVYAMIDAVVAALAP
jgi:hypothetical protein